LYSGLRRDHRRARRDREGTSREEVEERKIEGEDERQGNAIKGGRVRQGLG